MKKTTKQKILQLVLTAALAAGNVVPWLIAQDVAYSVAQNRHVLLGRYTVGQMTTLLSVLLISIPVLVLIWTKPENLKKRCLRLTAITVSVILAVFFFDLALRFMFPEPYIATGNVYRHQPNSVFRGTTRDIPKTAFSYPITQPGYRDVPYILTNDARGFRNREALGQCNILTIGDSFTEGSEVSDDQVWPVLLAKRIGGNVYNLGIGNGNPFTYLATLKEIGLELNPKTVFLMIYEGNDFRLKKAKPRSGFRYRLRTYRKRSPVTRAIKRTMIKNLAPVGVRRMTKVPENHPLWPVAWLPMAVPEGDNAKYYALEWGRLGSHWITGDTFRRSAGYQATTEILGQFKSICQEREIRLIVLYAPDKPHVVLPIARPRLSPKQVRAFLAMRINDLPPPDDCLNMLIDRLGVRESEIASFCRTESIEFRSLTHMLQQGIASGKQMYFTYDQHWTPAGHQVVADIVADALSGQAKGNRGR